MTRYLKKCHKFGIELSKTVEEAFALDAQNGNMFWVNVMSENWRMSEWHLKSYQIGNLYP